PLSEMKGDFLLDWSMYRNMIISEAPRSTSTTSAGAFMPLLDAGHNALFTTRMPGGDLLSLCL
ncbi:MAG: hypothetical protein ACK55I_30730, partial [bacterium]